MRAGEARVPVERLRDAVAEAMDRTSSHAVAREVGLSAPSLRAFVGGTNPRPSTVRKLTAWYLRYRRRTAGGTLDGETAAAAVSLLLEHFPPQARERVHDELYEWLGRRGGEVRAPTPVWVREALGMVRKKKR